MSESIPSIDPDHRDMELQARDKKWLRNLWLFPLIALALLMVLAIMTADGLRQEHLMIGLLLILTAFGFSMAGFVQLIRCVIRYRGIELPGKAKYLVFGLALNAVIISIPLLLFLQDYLFSKGIERHNKACGEIFTIQRELEYYYFEYKDWPSEKQGLAELHRTSIGLPISLIDPWGKPYRYRLKKSSERKGALAPYVWSSGPDGVSGTNDDIDDKTPRQMEHVNHWPAA